MTDRPAKRRASSLIEDEQVMKKPKYDTAADVVDASSSDIEDLLGRPAIPVKKTKKAAKAARVTKPQKSRKQHAKKDTMDIDESEAEPRRTPKIKAPPIASLFNPWHHNIVVPKKSEESWGRKPFPGPDGPQPHPDLPSARTSNAQTVPPLWEDRKYKFKPGQYHKTFGEDPEETDGPPQDQNNNLAIKLMDMRLMSRFSSEPRRLPVIYTYGRKPVDWHNAQALKALNDRRREAIGRITCDPPWTEMERECLADLCTEYPDASILELAERLNYRFMGDFKEKTAFSCDDLHEGRTIESVRYEYLMYKHLYDQGDVPDPIREEGDKTGMKKKDNKRVKTDTEVLLEDFGPKSGKAKDEDKIARKLARATPKRKSQAIIMDSDDEAEYDAKPNSDEEELLDLAGYYQPRSSQQVRHTSKHASQSDTSIYRRCTLSFILDSDRDSSSDLSDAPGTDRSSPQLKGSGRAITCAASKFTELSEIPEYPNQDQVQPGESLTPPRKLEPSFLNDNQKPPTSDPQAQNLNDFDDQMERVENEDVDEDAEDQDIEGEFIDSP